jgi:ABC-type nitrate/sulfonate/bicarbonate transport system ATPase subunit
MAGVSIRIKEKRFSEPLFCDFELEIEAGSVVALLGPSGIGKSTLLRMVAGIDRDYAGTIQVGDELAHEAPAPGFVFQDARLLPWLSAIDNVRLAGRERASELLAKVGLGEHGDAFPRALSGGMQRRVALARALAGQSELLLLDEPFVSLDAALADEMQDLLAGLIAAERPTVLLVTHSVAEAQRLADRVVRLEGRPVRIVEDRRK